MTKAEATATLEIKPIDETKAGANYRKLAPALKKNIERFLQPSREVVKLWENGNIYNAVDEWTAALRNTKDKRKIIMQFVRGKVQYTIKSGNKILLRTTDRNHAANKIAEYYNVYI